MIEFPSTKAHILLNIFTQWLWVVNGQINVPLYPIGYNYYVEVSINSINYSLIVSAMSY